MTLKSIPAEMLVTGLTLADHQSYSHPNSIGIHSPTGRRSKVLLDPSACLCGLPLGGSAAGSMSFGINGGHLFYSFLHNGLRENKKGMGLLCRKPDVDVALV